MASYNPASSSPHVPRDGTAGIKSLIRVWYRSQPRRIMKTGSTGQSQHDFESRLRLFKRGRSIFANGSECHLSYARRRRSLFQYRGLEEMGLWISASHSYFLGNGYVSRASSEIEAEILCSPDCVAEREGFESAIKHKFSNMQGDGWHESTRKTSVDRLTDRKRIAQT